MTDDLDLEGEAHVHEHLDKYGYCKDCNKRIMTHYRNWPLEDRPAYEDIVKRIEDLEEFVYYKRDD